MEATSLQTGQNSLVTSAASAMSGMLPLRETDPREVGGYRLLGRLGEGGQGVVFLALGPTGTEAAVKLLPPTTDPQVRSRFLKEVAAAQRVPRFCTAQVLDAGIFERRPFIVSEYVSGPSLVEVVHESGPRRGAELERIAVATLTALGAVHAVGMVHRDVKPANVLLGPDGPVVIDFGLAAVPGMTTTGPSGQVALGTPAFMAPEALAATRVTAAADMWSWAVTIAFAGTGELPFKGESLTATAFAILHSEPDVGNLPEPLGSLVHRCLDKEPAARPTARDTLSELMTAGVQLLGPLPPMATDLFADEEITSPRQPSAATSQPRHSARTDPTGPRRPALATSARRGGLRWRAVAAATALVLVAGAGLAAFMLAGQGRSPGRPTGSNNAASPQLRAEAAARTDAVNWVLNQVNRGTTVGCDALVCADLARQDYPAVQTLGPGSNDPLDCQLVVATADIRAHFGPRLAAVYAPVVMASFGSGAAKIEIRLVFPGGTKKFRAVERPALRARKTADAQLLTNSHIFVSATARAQLLSGRIDPRLPQLIAAMADAHPIRIVEFVNQSPGGGPASLLRSVDLATVDKAAHLSRVRYLRWMRDWVVSQRAQYRPQWSRAVTLPSGQVVQMIGYGVPSPLRY
jgi:predicted Ser/Thr protein kinase